MKRFIFDTLVDKENIVNQTKVINELQTRALNSGHIVLYGMRNTAKTSVIKNILFPYWKSKCQKPFIFYCDLMAVKNLEDISERFTIAFNEAYTSAFTMKSVISSGIKFLKGLKPTFQLSSDGSNGEFSLRNDFDSQLIDFEIIVKSLDNLEKQGIDVLICFDEFQDIAFVETAEAKLRNSLQNISFDIPVIISGSKQHILSDIFEKPRAPFYQWGHRLSMEEIPYDEYNIYIKERFKEEIKNTDDEVLVYLQEKLMKSPEAINRICYDANLYLNKPLSEKCVDELIIQLITNNRSSFEARLSYFSEAENRFLKHLAKAKFFEKLHTKEILKKINISSPAMLKMNKRLQNDGIIYKNNSKIFITDPFLMHFLRLKRLGSVTK